MFAEETNIFVSNHNIDGLTKTAKMNRMKLVAGSRKLLSLNIENQAKNYLDMEN
jgi:hypothetical protein